MDLMYQRVAKQAKNKTGAILFTLSLVAVIIGGGMSIEDYNTSRLGYEAYPTQKSMGWVVWLVALIPQLFQVFSVYIIVGMKDAKDDEREFYGFDLIRIVCFVGIIAWLVDGTFDYLYKSAPYTVTNITGLYFPALFESFLLYSVFSELCLSVGSGFLIASFREGGFDETIDLLSDVFYAVGKLMGVILAGVKDVFGSLGNGLRMKDRSKPRADNKHQQTQQNQPKSQQNQQRNHHQQQSHQPHDDKPTGGLGDFMRRP